MPSEDFAYMLIEKPGAFIFLGNGDGQMLHNPEYIFDYETIPFGSSWYAGMLEERLSAVEKISFVSILTNIIGKQKLLNELH